MKASCTTDPLRYLCRQSIIYMKIKYIKNKDIDRVRYDKSLNKAYNTNIFATSWYLDLVCDDWDLLTEGNYETICPLPIQKKLGLTIVRQPPKAPYLGVFSASHLPADKVAHFLKAIPFHNISLTLNHYNRINGYAHTDTRKVPVLDMIPPYEKIIERYSNKAKNILPVNDGTFVMRSLRSDEYMRFRSSIRRSSKVQNIQLARIINYTLRYKSAEIYSVYSPRNELIGAIFLIRTDNRLFLFDCIENKEGHKRLAIFRAINHILESNCERNFILEVPFHCSHLTSMISFDYHHCVKLKKGFL